MNVTLTQIAPVPSADGRPWLFARIEESDAADGTFVLRDTIDLATNGNGLDTNPAEPAVRSLTTGNGTGPGLWYRVIFVNELGDEQPTVPVQNAHGPTVNYRPSVLDVAELLRERTYDGGSNETGTFHAATRPTGDQVESTISKACGDVLIKIGRAPAAALVPAAKSVTALRAAMLVERSYFASQVAAGRSPYNELRDDYKDQLAELVQAIRDLGADEEPGTDDDQSIAGMPSFSFPGSSCHVEVAESPWPERPTWYGLGGRVC